VTSGEAQGESRWGTGWRAAAHTVTGAGVMDGRVMDGGVTDGGAAEYDEPARNPFLPEAGSPGERSDHA